MQMKTTLGIAFIFSATYALAQSAERPELVSCDGPYRDARLTVEEVDSLLTQHAIWLEKHTDTYSAVARADALRANLCGADLSGLDLRDRNFSRADLSSANLRGANLSNSTLKDTDLGFADLTDAALWGIDGQRINLTGATLVGAGFLNANLSEAVLLNSDARSIDLTLANLTSAKLYFSDLSGSKLFATTVKDAHVGGVDFSDVSYEVADGHPNIQTVSSALNLHRLKYGESPRALSELRAAVRTAGDLAQERALTYAIRKQNQARLVPTHAAFDRVFFEWTCGYCFYTWRPLVMLAALIPIFAVLYGVGMIKRDRAGIWKVWPEDAVLESERKPVRVDTGWVRTPMTSMYFSVLSAFHIGWRDLSLGNWLVRLQSDEYTLRATGWLRTIAGVQSILSVYFLALWALCYFSKPFA